MSAFVIQLVGAGPSPKHFLYKCSDGHTRCPQYLAERTPIKFAMEWNGDWTMSRSSEAHVAPPRADNLISKAA